MNTKNLIVLLLTFIIIILITDLVFNFSNTLMENFQSATCSTIDVFKSLISKIDGKVISIEYIKESDNEYYLPSPAKENYYIGLNGDGTLEEFTKDNDRIRWFLQKIEGPTDYGNLIEKESETQGYNTSINCVIYPFYILKSLSDNTKCLQFDYGKLIARPIGNYDSQKWDASKKPYIYKKGTENICYSHCDNSNYGNSVIHGGQNTNDKIKINLNVKDEYLKKLLENIDGSNSNNSQENNNSLMVPKDSIKSICKGCDLDL